MPYSPPWTQQDPAGRLVGGEHFARLADAQELVEQLNRRRRLVYLADEDFSPHLSAGAPIRAATFDGQQRPPLRALRQNLLDEVLSPAAGGLGGSPPTPASMEWLWPAPDADEGKVLVATPPTGGQVNLFQRLNGTDGWTDPSLAGAATAVRAVHLNELRAALERLVRGRWRLPIYLPAGLFSLLPDTPWLGDCIANSGTGELRAAGCVLARTAHQPPRGLAGVTARDARLEITAETACRVEVYHVSAAVDFAGDAPTWNQRAPGASLAWTSPGGTDPADATPLGTLDLAAGVPGALASAELAAAVGALLDGAEPNFLFRRADTGYETILLGACLEVTFDLA